MKQDLELLSVSPVLEPKLVELFRVFTAADERTYFDPHPFTPEQAHTIAHDEGRDFYSLALYEGHAVGYGFLRGWDEGFDIPSLGLSIHPDYRAAGLGLLLMRYLQSVATLRGCETMRLRVHKDNQRATALYEKLGYEFQEDSNDFLLGFLTLKQFQRTDTT